jgi:2-C-methyl-D-erythritol 4-phosphate cytidylyltransferase
MKITCIIPAAGKGLRLGGTIPKQYLRIDKIMILEHAVHSLFKGISAYPIDEYACIIACDLDWFETVQDILDRSGFEDTHAIVEGGQERKDSINAAFHHPLVQDSDVILIHDAARPFVPIDIIKNLIDKTRIHGACIPVLACKDTMKIVQDNLVSETIPRHILFSAQTPQVFSYRLYKNALDLHYKTSVYTDDASLFELCKFPISTVDGNEIMMKITTKQDLKIAEYLYTSMDIHNGD